MTGTLRMESLAERVADGTIHVIGITFGIAALATFIVTMWGSTDIGQQVSVYIYVGCLLAMLICSALYNMLDKENKQGLLRRLDHAAIFLLIAGTYTPLAAMVIGGITGSVLLTFIWSGALAGVLLKLVHIHKLDKLTVPLCLLLGWAVIFAFKPLQTNASPLAFWLILTGGLLYSLGTGFYIWKRLPFQNAIWHGFVLAAAACHFTAVLHDVALA